MERKTKKRLLILVLWLTLGIIVIIVLGYFTYSCIQLNDSGIARETFCGRTYMTYDLTSSVVFDETAKNARYIADGAGEIFMVEYEANILTLTSGEKVVNFAVVDENTLYGGAGNYYFYIGV